MVDGGPCDYCVSPSAPVQKMGLDFSDLFWTYSPTLGPGLGLGLDNFWHSHCFKRQSKFYLDIWMDNDAVGTDSHLVNPKVCCKVIILMAVFLDPFLEIAHLGQKTVDLLPLSR